MNTPMLSRTLTRTLLVALTLAVVPFALTACGDNAADGPPNVETDEVPMDAQMGNGMMEDGMMDGGGDWTAPASSLVWRRGRGCWSPFTRTIPLEHF